MARVFLRQVISALLLAVVAVGGGRLPTVDALVFHEQVGDAEIFRAHFEASSACHDDGCSMRSTAHESRLTPLLATPAIHAVLPESVVPPPPAPGVPQALPSSSHLSRAPPLFV